MSNDLEFECADQACVVVESELREQFRNSGLMVTCGRKEGQFEFRVWDRETTILVDEGIVTSARDMLKNDWDYTYPVRPIIPGQSLRLDIDFGSECGSLTIR